MDELTTHQLLVRIKELEDRLEESDQLIEAIKAGEVDAFAIGINNKSEIFTIQSGDYAYRVLIEAFEEGAINVTEEGLIVYSNPYFFHLLKLPYEKVVGSLIFDFIDPPSMIKFRRIFDESINGKRKGEINLTVNGNIIPVYVSLTSLQPQISTIGIIITDLSQKKKAEEAILKYQKDLELKNIELENSNAELASFSYIGSHDLKEPLRKIQAFSKRILETESFSEKTKDYFNRIIGAGERMENLIESMLKFSRVNTTELGFESYDLNQIIEESKTYLKESILEKQAQIVVEKLPVIKIVPVLFLQLITNLLDNAIKYSRAGVNPLIRISARMIDGERISSSFANKQKRYLQLDIADNGIGFSNEYSNKIFELFQRLHGKNDYSGTGIGLAICKKIASSHNGFILADGRPGEGSTFSVYIPA